MKRFNVKKLVALALSILALVILQDYELLGQRVEFEQPLHINDNGPQAEDPMLNVRLKSFDVSGFLIQNEHGSAHSWLPYTDGGIYLTSDTRDPKNGDVVFRQHDGTDYSDFMRIDGKSGVVRINDLEFQNSLPEFRKVFVNRAGDLVSTALGNYTLTGMDFGTNVRRAEISTFPSHAYIFHTVFDVFYSNGRTPMYASVHLPDGVAVTGLTAYIPDSRTDADLRVELKRIPIGADLFFAEEMTFVSSSATNTNGSRMYRSFDINNQIIDNNNYIYYVEAFPTADWDGTSGLSIAGVRIGYRH